MTDETKPMTYLQKAPEVEKFELQQRTARLFAYSGLFSDIKGVSVEQATAQAFVKIALGESMGFSAAESMTGIDIIRGRVAVGANLRAARMQLAGYSWEFGQLDNKGCKLKLKFQGEPIYQTVQTPDGEQRIPVVISYTEEDAKRAGLLDKDNYQKTPAEMYFARAVTRAQRWYAPGVLSLDIPTQEEVEVFQPMPVEPNRAIADKAKRTVEEIKQRLNDEQGESVPGVPDDTQAEKGSFKAVVETAQASLEKRRQREKPKGEMTQAGLVLEEF